MNPYVVRLVREIETLLKVQTGRHPLSAAELDCVLSAICEACLRVMLEYGAEPFEFLQQTISLTVSENGTAVLPERTVRIDSQTVRSSNGPIRLLDEADVLRRDPKLEKSGIPEYYWLIYDDQPMLRVWPKPDSDYEIQASVVQWPEGPGGISALPVPLQLAAALKAKSLSLAAFGLEHGRLGLEIEYEKLIQQIKDGLGQSGSRYIRLGSRNL